MNSSTAKEIIIDKLEDGDVEKVSVWKMLAEIKYFIENYCKPTKKNSKQRARIINILTTFIMNSYNKKVHDKKIIIVNVAPEQEVNNSIMIIDRHKFEQSLEAVAKHYLELAKIKSLELLSVDDVTQIDKTKEYFEAKLWQERSDLYGDGNIIQELKNAQLDIYSIEDIK